MVRYTTGGKSFIHRHFIEMGIRVLHPSSIDGSQNEMKADGVYLNELSDFSENDFKKLEKAAWTMKPTRWVTLPPPPK